ETRSAIRRDGGPVRFIEGRFEDIGHAQRLGDRSDARRRLQHELFAFDDTGPGDQKLPMTCADFEVSYLDFLRHRFQIYLISLRGSSWSMFLARPTPVATRRPRGWTSEKNRPVCASQRKQIDLNPMAQEVEIGFKSI